MYLAPRLLFLALSLCLCSCVSTVQTSGRFCSFSYDQGVIDKLVVPELKKAYGERYTMYEVGKPGILEKADTVQLIFGQGRIDVLDTPLFIIVVDRCASKVLKAYETSPFPSDAPRRTP